MIRRKPTQILGLLVALTVAACQPTDSPTGVPFEHATAFQPTTTTGTFVRICKLSYNEFVGLPDDGTVGTVFDFTVDATGPTVIAPSLSVATEPRADLDAEQDCPVVWEDPATDFDEQTLVSVTEEITPGFELASASYFYESDGVGRGYDLAGGNTVTLPPKGGLTISFKNVAVDTPPPPPPGGGEGCTPGYWRQSHHYDDWVGYHPTEDTFLGVFGVGPELELGSAVKARGGGFNALIRSAVASLLNASSADVDFDLSEEEIIQLVQDAYASGEPEALKDRLDGLNNQGCPLGEGPEDSEDEVENDDGPQGPNGKAKGNGKGKGPKGKK